MASTQDQHWFEGIGTTIDGDTFRHEVQATNEDEALLKLSLEYDDVRWYQADLIEPS